MTPAKGHEAERELPGEDIGHGVTMRFFTAFNSETRENERAGIIIAHRHPDGSICQGCVAFAVPAFANSERPKWDVECWSPLTISPSILDGECGLHGYVREGRWVPA